MFNFYTGLYVHYLSIHVYYKVMTVYIRIERLSVVGWAVSCNSVVGALVAQACDLDSYPSDSLPIFLSYNQPGYPVTSYLAIISMQSMIIFTCYTGQTVIQI